ncbi:hypothetical protein TNCT_707011 [Trichonephila clavata]|uniref:Uncharacterized protein n=1 Tax=Trichonephila clavata TaxID=2740835 RepID=A0A8X6FR76_TRICU|nr:hypothetical protein TNCT_445341 [Trichonephila clavata]GFQ94805.1 hypothetical protein TNCT_707011 [Trichonephila clavata]
MASNYRFGFFGHVNGFYSEGRFVVVEAALASIWTKESVVVTVDTTGHVYTPKDRETNSCVSQTIHGIPFPYPGTVRPEDLKKTMYDIYRERDGGRNLTVLVKGNEQKDLFESFGIPAMEVKMDLLNNCPKYEDLPHVELPFADPHGGEMVHAYGGVKCSRIIAYTFARFVRQKLDAGESEVRTVIYFDLSKFKTFDRISVVKNNTSYVFNFK